MLYSRFPINFKQSLNLTHFCRIPLVTRVSLPQILESYSRLQTDPISAVIPKDAFTHPANLHLTLGELSLPTLSHVEDALELLKSSIARQADRPLTVHVVGIGKSLVSRNPRDLSSALRLYSRIEDPTNSLRRFCQGVHSALRDADFLKQNPFQTDIIPLQTIVMSTRRLARGRVIGKQQKGFLRPRIDATDIHCKYKDLVLMKDVQLHDLHISEMGRKKVLYEDVVVSGYRNIATVSLPGTGGQSMKPLQTEMNVSIPVRSPD